MATDLIEVHFNQSRLKTFDRCPKQFEYKYLQNLQPKRKQRALFLGSWIHACLESHYRDGDWKIGHQIYVNEWNKLFDEEKEELSKKGNSKNPTPLPTVVERIMKSYFWYYREDGWTPKYIETVLEVPTPLKVNGKIFIFKGRLDLVIEDEDGLLWLVDHKSAGSIPQPTAFHAMDPQLMLYPWAAEKQFGIELAGVIYNYVGSKAPSIPKINKNGSLSKRKVKTDYPTLLRFLKQNGYDTADFKPVLKQLYRKSEFLRRYKLPREPRVTKEILLDTLSKIKRIDETKRFTRTITRDCVRCSYADLCRAELNGFNTDIMRQSHFDVTEEDYVVGSISRAVLEDVDDEEEG